MDMKILIDELDMVLPHISS